MKKMTDGGLCAALALSAAAFLCAPAAHADDKPKVSGTTQSAAKSASAPQGGTQQAKGTAGEKVGSASPGSTDMGTGGNIAGIKKPSPPKVPQDAAAKKKAVQQ